VFPNVPNCSNRVDRNVVERASKSVSESRRTLATTYWSRVFGFLLVV